MWSDGCSSQFQSKYVFALMTDFDKSVQLEWHWNEVHHGKGPMDGIGQKIERVVFGSMKNVLENNFSAYFKHVWLKFRC